MRSLKAPSKMMVICMLVGCSSKGSDEKLNHQAIMLHNSMIKKANEIQHRFNEITADSTINKDSIKILSETFEQWKSDLVEVPGNEQHDHLGHDHDHTHKVPEVTEEQMLEIQKELDRRLSTIGTRIMNLKPKLNHVEHQH